MFEPSMELAPHASSKPPDSGRSALPTTQLAAGMPTVSIYQTGRSISVPGFRTGSVGNQTKKVSLVQKYVHTVSHNTSSIKDGSNHFATEFLPEAAFSDNTLMNNYRRRAGGRANLHCKVLLPY
jgi:hypothetical protein